MTSTLQSVKLIQNTHLQVKPVGAAEGIGEANRDDMGAGWLAAAAAAGGGAAVLAGAGVAERTRKNLLLKKKVKHLFLYISESFKTNLQV